ncbi:MAG: molybdenum cofactor guanylyltransferase MobA [Gammaproteobacteria bacterium]
MIPDDITGVLLAGGRARRMGGEDKGLLPLAGLPLAARTLARLSPQVGAVVINANRNAARYAEFGRVVADEIGGFCGPLAGIHAGMRAAAGGWALSAPCDSPFLPADLAQTLARAAQNARADIAVAVAGERIQPAFLLVRAALADDLAAFLADGGRKIDLWYPRHSHIFADFSDAGAFANINTPEELAAAAARFAAR